VLVQNVDKEEQKQRLLFYSGNVKQLVEKLDILLDLNVATEDDLLIKILEAQQEISVTFDSVTHKVTNIE
jgi:hypothetical protein